MLFSTMFCQKLLDTFIFMTEFSFFVLYSEFKEDGEKLTIEKIDDKEDDKLNKGNNCRHKHTVNIFFFLPTECHIYVRFHSSLLSIVVLCTLGFKLLGMF